MECSALQLDYMIKTYNIGRFEIKIIQHAANRWDGIILKDGVSYQVMIGIAKSGLEVALWVLNILEYEDSLDKEPEVLQPCSIVFRC